MLLRLCTPIFQSFERIWDPIKISINLSVVMLVLVACTCNPASLEAEFWNGVGLILW